MPTMIGSTLKRLDDKAKETETALYSAGKRTLFQLPKTHILSIQRQNPSPDRRYARGGRSQILLLPSVHLEHL